MTRNNIFWRDIGVYWYLFSNLAVIESEKRVMRRKEEQDGGECTRRSDYGREGAAGRGVGEKEDIWTCNNEPLLLLLIIHAFTQNFLCRIPILLSCGRNAVLHHHGRLQELDADQTQHSYFLASAQALWPPSSATTAACFWGRLWPASSSRSRPSGPRLISER